MAHGKLSSMAITAAGNTAVYQAPANCVMAEVSIYINNGSDNPSEFVVAITSDPANVAPADILESKALVTGHGTILLEGLVLSPGEHIVVNASLGNASVRVMGSEKTKP